MTIIPFPGKARPEPSLRDLHLPVAARANHRLRFAPPGSAQKAVSPPAALAWLDEAMAEGPALAAVVISGPGDPLAEPGPTLETLRLVHAAYPALPLRVTTLGFGLAEHAAQFSFLGVEQVTLLVDAVSPETASGLYAWIRPGTRTILLPAAIDLLLEEQAKAASACKETGMRVVIRTTVYPGGNAEEVEAIAQRFAALGAAGICLVPHCPPAGAEAGPAAPALKLMDALRLRAGNHLPLVEDTEPFGDSPGAERTSGAAPTGPLFPKPSASRPNVAVASTNGMEVDLHLGQATKILIYGPRNDGLPSLLGVRTAPPAGGGGSRWEQLARRLHDCFALCTASAGESPRQALGALGITVLVTEGDITSAVDALYGGGKKGRGMRGK